MLLNEEKGQAKGEAEISGIQRAERCDGNSCGAQILQLRYQMSNGGNLSVRVAGRSLDAGEGDGCGV